MGLISGMVMGVVVGVAIMAGWSRVMQQRSRKRVAKAADIKALGSLGRDDLKKLCGDNFPEWISFPQYEQNGAGCGYVEWADPALPEFWSHLIGDLRDAVWRLRSDGVLSVSQQNEETEPSVQA